MKKTERYTQLVFNTDCAEEEKMRELCVYAEKEVTKIYVDFGKALHKLYGSTVLKLCQAEQKWIKEVRELYEENCSAVIQEEEIPMPGKRRTRHVQK